MDGNLRQVLVGNHLVDVVPLADGFRVGVYSEAQIDGFDSGSGVYLLNGPAILVWDIVNPDPTPMGRITFTRTDGGATEVHEAHWQGTAGDRAP